jgi:demethylmenaquinone methyltransferase/2-methoxy-6-polyprenyl-1,4-benzoquinol methylase
MRDGTVLREKAGPQGSVVGIEESPEMAAVAREQVAREGWRNVTVVQSLAEDAEIEVTADAALFCAVHDILQCPDALRNVMSKQRPGAWMAADGGREHAGEDAARFLCAELPGFHRPWSHLEQLVEDVRIREMALGSGYIVTGRAPRARS